MATRRKKTATPGARTVGSKNLGKTKKTHAKSKKASAYVTSKEYSPITKRTYELETKRKGSTSGYKTSTDKKGRKKYYKSRTVTK